MMLHFAATAIPLMPLDTDFVRWFNSGLGTFPRFDNVLHMLNNSVLLKGAPFMILIWWLGSGGGGERAAQRDFLTRSIVGLLVALLVARVLQDVGPHHVRPVSDPALGLKAFLDNDPNYFSKLNSFPSDHAVEFFAMSLAIATRRFWLGMAGFAWSLVFICLPRIYFGYHYPSDILAGAVIGVTIMAIALTLPIPRRVQMGFERLQMQAPGVLPATQFGIALEMANNFDDIRAVLAGLHLA
jgi:undecaprenyl-diphosphatase